MSVARRTSAPGRYSRLTVRFRADVAATRPPWITSRTRSVTKSQPEANRPSLPRLQWQLLPNELALVPRAPDRLSISVHLSFLTVGNGDRCSPLAWAGRLSGHQADLATPEAVTRLRQSTQCGHSDPGTRTTATRPRYTALRAIPLGCLPRDCLQTRVESGRHALPGGLGGSGSQEALALHCQAVFEACLLRGDRTLRQ